MLLLGPIENDPARRVWLTQREQRPKCRGQAAPLCFTDPRQEADGVADCGDLDGCEAPNALPPVTTCTEVVVKVPAMVIEIYAGAAGMGARSLAANAMAPGGTPVDADHFTSTRARLCQPPYILCTLHT